MNKIKPLLNKWVLLILCIALACTQVNAAGIVNFNQTDNMPQETVYDNNTNATETTENIETYYQNDKICIYNYNQLKQIGSDAYVYTGDKDGSIGSGEVVKNKGTELRYTSDAQYVLMSDIEMSTDYIWTLPNNFTGSITGTTRESTSLYNKETDTITIYNPYQLMVLAQDNSETEPVMSLDYDAPQFGMGQMVYPNGENQSYLTYSKSHKYVLSQSFDSSKPELVADQVSENVSTENAEGRDFKGQVVKTIGNKTYILIGNEAQLRKIGTDTKVYGAVYQAYQDVLKWKVDKDKNGKPIMLYGGDADLTKNQNGVSDYTFGGIQETNKSLSNVSPLKPRGRCGVDQNTGEINPDLDIDKAANQKYSANANYIIFRDIDLSSSSWKPLNFQGTMVGAKSTNNKIWNVGAKIEKPVISNVKVEQTDKLNVGEQMGVGFFSTISSEVSEHDIGLSKELVQVSNIKFDNMKVHTTTTETWHPSTLVSTLTSTLGKLLGGLVSGLTFILTFGQVKIDLGKTLGDVLDARKKDPTALATGAIAGRVEGHVEVSNIEVNNADVKNVNNNTGGFVGYVVGKTQYSGLSNALGGLVKLLTNILNVIPGLGLGDLITILLGNAIPVSKLIPTGYINAKIKNCSINGLSISTSSEKDYAGGFIGTSQTGGLADVASEEDLKGWITKDTSVLDINGLLTAVKYLIPTYTLCTVTYVNGGGVSADTAGGFVGNFQSGTLNNHDAGQGNYYSVYNLDHVNGQSYAGGFGGNVYSGALADAGKGISILGGLKGLNVDVGQLLNLINAYIPYVQYAGVKSDSGFTVSTNKLKSDDTHAGSAGGFIGYGSGVQISYCDVTHLKHTKVTPPKDLESTEAPTYFNNESQYAVTGARYAGGYIGYMDIGSAASVGKGLSILGASIGINNVLDALNVVVSTIEHSHVSGNPGGFAVKASYKNTASDASDNDVLGDAGGFAGKISGGHIQDSNANNFSYIIGQLTAGGYVGDLQPGNIANVLDDASILGGLVKADSVLASVAEDFVPTIRNSSTTCVPCGGAVRAQASSTTQVQRGMAGGYVGHNEGGHIWGNNTKKWKGKDYTGPTSTCKAVRIRSVYGEEIAGGFTGLMESADTASTGNLSLLWGLVKVDNILGALSVVYPTEENTAVYGPLALMDYETWNKWVEFVGKYGGYGSDLAEHGKVNNQAGLDAIINKYAYGYNVVAGRVNYRDEIKLAIGGAAGGYVGSMQTGTITNGQAYQTKKVKGLRTAGGFAGEMINGGAADLGGVNILGLNLQLGRMIDVLNVFVPVIKKSSVEGYQSGLTVESTGTNNKDNCGYAGGYVGKLIGGQIWGDSTAHCQVKKLRRVDGRSYVGGFVGSSRPGSVATLNPTAGEGLLSQLLNKLLSTPSDLIKVLNATVATIRYADVESWDDWGFIVNGAYTTGKNNTSYAKTAGGFAGMLEGTVLGKKDSPTAGISVTNIRSVIAGEYAGGCFGVADVAGVANISAGNETSLLDKLLKLGRTDVLDAFRSYVYYGNVSGSEDAGLSVNANVAKKIGQNNQVTYSGTAGGFGGSLLNGSIKNSTVTQLSNVRGLNSVGGFIGYSGKSGVVKADKIDVLGNNTGQLLGGALGVMDIFGSHIDDCSVSGTSDGYTVQSQNGEEQIAGGFIGYANLARMSKCTAGSDSDLNSGLKQVASGGTAGGFAGRTSFAYLADLKLDSGPVNVIFMLVNKLIKALYLDKLQGSNLLKINLGIIKVEALYKGNLLHVNLLGLDISVGLSKKSTDNKQQTDLAIITIGDSSIKLPCDENGLLDDNDTKSNISVSLIKANRTKITDSNVYGVSYGYDVYAGGANNNTDGTATDGRSGGFVGFNDEGLLKNNNMYYCDVVRGTKDLVGPFSGKSKLDSVYDFNKLEKVEGEGNNYRIYRKLDKSLTQIKNNNKVLNSSYEKNNGWDIYTIKHMDIVKAFNNLENAVLSNGSETADLKAYESPAKAVLMADTKTTLNTGESEIPEPSESQDPCDKLVKLTINKVWKDFDNFDNKRPDSITVTISRTWKDATGKEQTQTVPNYESYRITGSINKSTWQEVIKGLPAYKTESDGTVRYYKYSVTEAEINGYTTTIKTSDDGFTFMITNKHFPCLPNTGGFGNYLFYAIAILLFFVYFDMRYRKNKENKAEKL